MPKIQSIRDTLYTLDHKLSNVTEYVMSKTDHIAQKIRTIEDKITLDNAKIAIFSSLYTKMQALHNAAGNLTSTSYGRSDLFNNKVISPVGITKEKFLQYLDIDINDMFSVKQDTYQVTIKSFAKPASMESINFSNTKASVTQSAAGNNPFLFKEGTIKIGIENNLTKLSCAKGDAFEFTDPDAPLIYYATCLNNTIQPGTFWINNTPIQLTNTETLYSLAQKINATLVNSVTASVTKGSNNNFLFELRSANIGAQFRYDVEDPDNIFGGATFTSTVTPDLNFWDTVPINLSVGDSLASIAQKINALQSQTYINANILKKDTSAYTLLIQSQYSGIENTFKIFDSLSPTNILNGFSSGLVTMDVFRTFSNTQEVMRSIRFPDTDITPVVQTGTDPFLFAPGNLYIIINNNLKFLSCPSDAASIVYFDSNSSAIIDNNQVSSCFNNKFNPGSFWIAGIKINLESNDSLEDIAQKINNASLSVSAKIKSTTSGFSVYLFSKNIGKEFDFTVNDPLFVWGGAQFLSPQSPELLDKSQVTLTGGDKLVDVTNKINAVSSDTNVGATMIADDSQYRLLLQFGSLNPNPVLIYDGTILDGINKGVVTQDVFNTKLTSIITAASNANFTINSAIFNKPLNTITDVIPGLIIRLISTSPEATSIGFKIAPDIEAALKGTVNFIDTYNDLRKFIILQQLRGEDGRFIEKAQIANNGNVLQTFAPILSNTAIQIVGSNIGIISTTQPSKYDSKGTVTEPEYANLLALNQDIFFSTLINNYENLKKALSYYFTSSSPNFNIPPLRSNIKIGGGKVCNYIVNVDVQRAIQATQTVNITIANITTPVTTDNPQLERFIAGTFYINNCPVTLSVNDTLLDIAHKINATTPCSRTYTTIAEIVPNVYTLALSSTIPSLKDQKSQYPYPIQITDLTKVRNSLFIPVSTKQRTNDFASVSDMKAGTITINGISIVLERGSTYSESLNNAVEGWATVINSYQSTTHVYAQKYENDNASFYLSFTSVTPSMNELDFVIMDTTNILNLQNPEVAQQGTKFLNTPDIAEIFVNTADGNSTQKATSFVINSMSNTSCSGIISITNLPNEQLTIKNMSIAYTGSGVEGNATITAEQGGAETLYNAINPFIDTIGGSIPIQIKALQSHIVQNNREKNRLEQSLSKAKKDAEKQFAKMQSMLQQGQNLESMLSHVQATFNNEL